SRSVTSAVPSGRKSRPQGTSRPAASSSGSWGTGAVVGSGEVVAGAGVGGAVAVVGTGVAGAVAPSPPPPPHATRTTTASSAAVVVLARRPTGPPSEDGLAARDAEDRAGDVARVVGGEVDEGGRDLDRVAGPTERRVLAELGHRLRGLGGRLQRGPDRARRHGVDADAPRAQLRGEVDREVVDRR